MIVHEALPRGDGEKLAVGIEHRFATTLEGRAAKNDQYALLWAVQAHAWGRHGAPGLPRQLWHAFRYGLLMGAWWRGGAAGVRLSWAVAQDHARKYERLREVEEGRHDDLVRAWREGEFAALLEQVRARCAS